MQRVVVFLDFQNVYHRARGCFCRGDAPHWEGQVDCLALGQRLVARGSHARELKQVRAYRGMPSSARDPRAYGANRRQSARLVGRGQGRVQIISRPLRYPAAYPREKPEEKGIDVALAVDFVMMAARDEYDVGILMSTDTDLVPALEAVTELRGPRCEVVAWKNPRGGSSRLAVRGHDVSCHWLEAADYGAVFDDTDYTVP